MNLETRIYLYPQKPAEARLPEDLLEALEELNDLAKETCTPNGTLAFCLEDEPPQELMRRLEAHAREGLVNLVVFRERPAHPWEDPGYEGHFLGHNSSGRLVEASGIKTDDAQRPLFAVDPDTDLEGNLDRLEAFYRNVAGPLGEVRAARGRFPEAVMG